MEKRRRITEIYREGLAEVPGLRTMSDLPGIEHNYAYFPLLVDEKEFGLTRDELFNYLGVRNVFTRKYFYPLTVDYECFKGQYDYLPLPHARYVAKRIMTLPLYGALPSEVAERIVSFIREAAGK